MRRIIFSPTRSGSSALLRCFENNPAVARVYHQPIKSGYRQDGVFDYSFYDFDGVGGVHVAKETVGGFVLPEAEFSPLAADDELERIGPWRASARQIERLEPLVLVRDPLQTWASIERLNKFSAGISPYQSPFEFFQVSFRLLVEFLVAAREQSLPLRCVTQEQLAADPVQVLRQVCAAWNLPWAESMIEWPLPYGDHTWFSDETRHRMATDPRFRKSKEVLEASPRYEYRRAQLSPEDVTNEETIERELRPLYSAADELARHDFE